MTRVALRPGLYDPGSDVPGLQGTRCDGCGRRFFPPLSIGCEVCGSEALVPEALATTGVVHSNARVHLHSGQDIQGPFTIVEVRLDDGPLVRGVLEGTQADAPDLVDRRVAAHWASVGADDAGNERVEPRFHLIDEETGT